MNSLFSKEKWQYAFYTVSHPMDAYYEIRHRGRGSVPIAVVLVILFSFSFSANRLLASFVVNDTDPRSVNSLTELGAVLLLYLLFCVSNWSITCLMEGEGRMKDIAIAIGYGMTPMIFCFNLATIVSRFVADGEQAFYWMILAIGVAYGLIMILMGIMTVQNFTLGKTLLTIVLTFLAMLIIIFLILLVADLINQVYSFLYSIYQEMIFRT
ncbi:MAG: YIP1 family protein [Clostridiales bacterium]|nr:YIP1 family protein [Clostridiales bacterium]